MTNYDNNNQGAIWKNERKQSDKHPDYNGAITIDGKEYWLSAWRGNKENPKAPVLSFRVTPKDAPAATPKSTAEVSDFDDVQF